MHKRIAFTITAVGILTVACGGTSQPTRPDRGSNAGTPVPVDAASAASIPPGVNNTNAVIPLAQANSNARRKAVDTPVSGQPPPLTFRPSGENSETAVTMDKDGLFVEVRVFRDHPQFAKIEATWVGLPLKELKFTLRNGQVVTKRTERLTNLQTATTAELAEIAGLSSQ